MLYRVSDDQIRQLLELPLPLGLAFRDLALDLLEARGALRILASGLADSLDSDVPASRRPTTRAAACDALGLSFDDTSLRDLLVALRDLDGDKPCSFDVVPS